MGKFSIRNIKDVYTDIFGAVVMGLGTFMWYQTKIDTTQWIISLCVGFVFLWLEDKAILGLIKKKINKDLDKE